MDKQVVHRFINQQREVLIILKEAHKVHLGHVQVPMTIPFIKVRLGDTLRFFINHNERHMGQIHRTLQTEYPIRKTESR